MTKKQYAASRMPNDVEVRYLKESDRIRVLQDGETILEGNTDEVTTIYVALKAFFESK